MLREMIKMRETLLDVLQTDFILMMQNQFSAKKKTVTAQCV